MKQFIILLSLLFSLHAFAQNDCSYMHKGTFKDLADEDKNAYLVIDEDYLIDYFQQGNYFIKSKIEWTDDCHYTLTFLETNAPDIDLPKGTKLKVEIMAVKDGIVSYQYLPAGHLPPRQLLKIKD